MQKRAKIVRWLFPTIIFCGATCAAQSANFARDTRYRQEFPIVMQTKAVAGQSAVGTVMEGKLFIATLVKGTVIPAGAVFTGKVEESVAKGDGLPSHLVVHLTEARWEAKSLKVDLFLTAFYYQRTRSEADSGEEIADLPTRDPFADMIKRGKMQRPTTRYPQRRAIEDVKQERGSGNKVLLTSEKRNVRIDRGDICSFEGSAPAKATSDGEKASPAEKK